MTESEIKTAILRSLKKVAPEADPNEISPQENFREALDLDSFDFLNFLVGLNEELGVEISESDYGQLTTLADIIAYLSERVEQKR